MSLVDHPAFSTYEPVPTSELHRREAVELHMPEVEWDKPEIQAFIAGRDKRSRPHLEATAQAIARAELRVHEAYQARMALAERMYKVWAFLTLWGSYENRHIGWARPRLKKGGRKMAGWRVWATTANGSKTVAQASGRVPYEAAEKLADMLRLL